MTTAQITGDSTMREVLSAYPGAQRALMRRYHIGGCQSCGFEPDERLADVLARKEITDVDEVITHIQAAHEQEQKIQISPEELDAALKGQTPPRLIDVRSMQEQNMVKLDGALPATQDLVQEMMNGWSKETPIVVYCHHGMRSLDAASYLIGHGFTDVRSLSGGIDAWAEKIDPALPRY